MTSNKRFSAIILAGDRGADDEMAGTFPGRKALLDINGRPMVSYVLEAAEEAKSISDIYVVANHVKDIEQGLVRAGRNVKRIRFIEGGASPVNSVLKTIEALKPGYPVLVLTGDNPLLTAPDLDDFCRKSLRKEGADVTFAVATRSRLEAEYPGGRRTFVNLKGEGYSGCNLYALLTPKALDAGRYWLKVEADRKKTLSMIAGLGFGIFIRVLTRTITLEEALRRVSPILGATIRAILALQPRIAIDVDRPGQADMVREILTKEG